MTNKGLIALIGGIAGIFVVGLIVAVVVFVMSRSDGESDVIEESATIVERTHERTPDDYPESEPTPTLLPPTVPAHAIGVRQDGTVVSSGLNAHGQTDVSGWRLW